MEMIPHHSEKPVVQPPLRQLFTRTVRVVVAVIHEGHNLNRALAQQAEVGRPAVQDMAYRCLREYGSLCALRDGLLNKPLQDTRIACLLLIALNQLRSRTEQAHTIVNEATEAAGALHAWARGLTNAILRNALRRHAPQGMWKDTPYPSAQPFPLASHATSQALIAQWNHPEWWIENLRVVYPQHWQSILTAGNQHPPFMLRVNTRQMNTLSYLQHLQAVGIAGDILHNECIVLHQAIPVSQLPGFELGWVSVQDAGAQLAARYLNIQKNQKVLDACCAPGGKSAHLLELYDIDLIALDNDASRLVRVQDNLTRLRLKAKCIQGDAGEIETWWDGNGFDRILADVPCSASGVVRRHPDIKWLRRQEDILNFTQQQARILKSLWSCLKPRGKLLYVTCSVFPEENQLQIDSFLASHDNARQLVINDFDLPAQALMGQLLPSTQHDGFFYALLEKN